MISRRIFIGTAFAPAAGGRLYAQAAIGPSSEWGERVLDTHLHLRKEPGACLTHMQGCGVTHAVLLTQAADEERAAAEMKRYPGRFARSVAADPAQPGADETFRGALGKGAISIGEIKYHLALDSPEMQKLYGIAADARVPVMMHIQNFPHFPGEMPYNTGYPDFDKMLRAHPKTTFIGHGDLFWAHISADVPADRGYPAGPVKPGGLTDKWLKQFPNLYADMSANSGNNALSRDPEFSRGFFDRHQDKLIFGSDCSCSDGHGAGVSQNNNPEAKRLQGKCVARATLAMAKETASPAVFRKAVWENGVRVFRLSF